MNIAELSMSMSAAQVNTAFGVAMLAKSLDAVSDTGAQITDMIDSAALERSVNPNIGANLDMYV